MWLGYDRALLGRVCQRFANRMKPTLRARSKYAHGLRSSAKLHPGVLIVVQRFRSDLGLYVHLHALVTDGCFEAPPMPNEAVVFRPAAGHNTCASRTCCGRCSAYTATSRSTSRMVTASLSTRGSWPASSSPLPQRAVGPSHARHLDAPTAEGDRVVLAHRSGRAMQEDLTEVDAAGDGAHMPRRPEWPGGMSRPHFL